LGASKRDFDVFHLNFLAAVIVPVALFGDQITDDSSLIFVFGAPLLLVFSWLMIHRANPDSNRPSPIWAWLFHLGLLLILCRVLLVESTVFNIVATVLLWVLSVFLIEKDWMWTHSPPLYRIDNIVPPSSQGIGRTEKNHSLAPVKSSNYKFCILGHSKSGKSSFIAGLWAVLTDSRMNDLWHGSADYLERHALTNIIDTHDIKDILRGEAVGQMGEQFEPGVHDMQLLNKFMSHRGYAFLMGEEIANGKMPPAYDPVTKIKNPCPVHLRPGNPETANALNKERDIVLSKNAIERKLLDSTREISDRLSIEAELTANVTRTGQMMALPVIKKELEEVPFVVKLGTLDIPGEIYNQAIRVLGTQLSLFESSRTFDQLQRKLAPKVVNLPERGAISNICRIISGYTTVLLLLDCEALADITKPERQREEILHTQNSLRVMNQIARYPDTDLESVVVLLNKADKILAGTRDEEMRMSTTAVPNRWADLSNRHLAMTFLDETTSGSLRGNLNHLDVNAYFCCTFGGVVQLETESADIDHPPYPLIPINVVEPILRELLEHEHSLSKGD